MEVIGKLTVAFLAAQHTEEDKSTTFYEMQYKYPYRGRHAMMCA
jgi:hypothetical protein